MTSFSLLTLNTFGIPFFISYRRIQRLAIRLNQLAPSVLCLQEIQQNLYLAPLKHYLTSYSNFNFFHNPIAPKGGLFTAVSPACEVTESHFYPFPNQGRPISIGFSDWALNKGVLMVSLKLDGEPFIIMNTHLQANYLADWHPSNSQTKIQLDQVSYLAELAHGQPGDAWVVICGDFNFPRQAPAYKHMVLQSGLIDALVDDPRPTYQPFPLVSAKWQTNLDYIFYRRPVKVTSIISADIVPIVNNSARWSFQRFLTDHHALTLTVH